MRALTYPASIEAEGPGDFVVQFRDLPEAITGAASAELALDLAADALAAAIEHYLDNGLEVPAPSPAVAGEHLVPIAPSSAARLLLVREMAARNVSGRALAGMLGKDEKAVRRAVAGKGASLELTLAALRALGVRPALAA